MDTVPASNEIDEHEYVDNFFSRKSHKKQGTKLSRSTPSTSKIELILAVELFLFLSTIPFSTRSYKQL